jgi:hypothetical protein
VMSHSFAVLVPFSILVAPNVYLYNCHKKSHCFSSV